MVLSDRTIKEELAKGRLKIEPLDESCIQPASVDLHLDRRLLVFNTGVFPYAIDLRHPLDGLTREEQISKRGPYALQPGEFILGSTVESITLPDDIVARLEGKSSLGRVGLLIHSTAGYVDPGWSGQLTLEISSVARMPILLYGGMKISQISFLRLTTPAERPYGHPALKSKYLGQSGPTRTRYFEEFGPQTHLLPSSAAAVKVNEAARKEINNALREWLKNSRFGGSVVRFAEALGLPPKTVEDWIYRNTKPGPINRRKLYEITKLPQFAIEGKAEVLLPQDTS